jgi:hypothetical protein
LDSKKLIETRGEEPAFIPGHVGESWQKVDFGLGASTMQSSPEVQDSLPPQQRHWARMIIYALIGSGLFCLGLFILSKLF